ncbi:MAG: TRAP transporter large permease subunit [Rhodovarius sp.]|nr:TRAP transporter large permease subunit [Rhodovarius sp.]MCX7933142.1 TRAP transporter large permease subunit [Rhodovarius sp.]MDW8314530.1 TRAP transporter large permease subunit [Rhodovarius sp.]
MPLMEIYAIAMLVAFFLLLMVGVPVALTLAVSGFVFGWLGFGPMLFHLLPARIFGVVTNYTLLAIPLFVFMGVMLEKSRLAEDLMTVVGRLAGNLRGGLALGVVGVGVLMGATTGIVGATVVTLALLALPAMMQRGYDRGLACGVICASGTLGQIIPPALILLLLADIMNLSVGTLFAAAVFPGLLLAGLFAAYILLLGLVRPAACPAVPAAERSAMPRAELLRRLLRVALPPVGLIVAVLGSIIGGVAAPTEAAAMGALGAVLVTALGRRLSAALVWESAAAAARITAMMMLVLICAQVFALAFRGLRGEQLIEDLFAFLPGGVEADILFMLLLVFVLGFFLEWIEISYIAVPLFLPVFAAAQVDPVWLATLIAVMLQTSFLTPPFGWALFFLRGAAPPEITTGQIYRGVVPFVLLQILAVGLVFLAPGLATWLPQAIGW